MKDIDTKSFEILQIREEFRDRYWLKRDPIYKDRLLWRAQTFRQIVHLLPGQTILELGAGKSLFTRQLALVSRRENPITAVSFTHSDSFAGDLEPVIDFHRSSAFPGYLAGKDFDFIISMDLLDKRNCSWFMKNVFNMLKPGGQIVFYESNPRNLMHKLRSSLAKFFGKDDPRDLVSYSAISNLLSDAGFIEPLVLYNDFVYAPLTRSLVWLLRNLSIILENTPRIRSMAGSILVHAQKPGQVVEGPKISLSDHKKFYQSVSVVIPCHNEEANIEPMITKLKSYYGDYLYEIIPVDDNSKDETTKVIRRLAHNDASIKPIYRHPPNGVGRAIADGLRMAKGEYVLTMDCDFHNILPEIRDLFDASAEGYDVVVGSRFSRHSVLLNYPLNKIIANRGFHLLAQIMFLSRFRDLTNNLKLMRKEVVDRLRLTQPGFAVNAETGLQPLLMGYRVKEVPMSWINRNREMGVSSFRLAKVGRGYCQVLLQLSFNTFFGLMKLQ